MTNKITASVEFYFKGKAFKPSVDLDLDLIMKQHGALPDLHHLLAEKDNIDTYSYEFEIMLVEELKFSNAEGDAVQFLTDHQFDQHAFIQHWNEQNILSQLAPNLKQELNIDDIEQNQALKAVILKAYYLGKNQ